MSETYCRHGSRDFECDTCIKASRIMEEREKYAEHVRQESRPQITPKKPVLRLGSLQEMHADMLIRQPARDLILMALVESERRTFTRAEVVVVAWKRFPQRFSLAGYDLPDSSKVCSVMDGERGLVKQGFLRKNGEYYSIIAKVKNGQAPRSDRDHAIAGEGVEPEHETPLVEESSGREAIPELGEAGDVGGRADAGD